MAATNQDVFDMYLAAKSHDSENRSKWLAYAIARFHQCLKINKGLGWSINEFLSHVWGMQPCMYDCTYDLIRPGYVGFHYTFQHMNIVDGHIKILLPSAEVVMEGNDRLTVFVPCNEYEREHYRLQNIARIRSDRISMANTHPGRFASQFVLYFGGLDVEFTTPLESNPDNVTLQTINEAYEVRALYNPEIELAHLIAKYEEVTCERVILRIVDEGEVVFIRDDDDVDSVRSH